MLPTPEDVFCCVCCNDVDSDGTRAVEIGVVVGNIVGGGGNDMGWGRFIPAKRIHFSKRHEEHIELAVDVQ